MNRLDLVEDLRSDCAPATISCRLGATLATATPCAPSSAGNFDELLTRQSGHRQPGLRRLYRYIDSEKPGYLRLEAWVKGRARNLTPESVAAFVAAFNDKSSRAT